MFHVEHPASLPSTTCLLCDNKAFTKFMELSDYFLTQEKFTLYRCNACGLIHTTPVPALSKLSDYYASEEYISHSGKKTNLIGKVYLSVRKYTHARKYKLVNKYSRGRSILDIGCATGEFLNFCSARGMMVTGIEPNPKARNFAVSQYNLNVKDEHEIDQLQSDSIDTITMWHVLEHVPDLNRRMSDLFRLLKDDGTAYIALPNHLSFDTKYYGKYWAAWDVPRHLYHFDRNSFRQLAMKHNFKVTAVLPMHFDAFYVSLLSEKYKNGKSSLLNALLVGLRSNLRAMAGKGEFSSLIYVIKKNGTINP